MANRLICGLAAFVAIQFEERDLTRVHGISYENYRGDVPMIVPVRLGLFHKAVGSASSRKAAAAPASFAE